MSSLSLQATSDTRDGGFAHRSPFQVTIATDPQAALDHR